MRRLPSLNSLRVFESVARHLSFSRAAYELGVTQGAVSKQVRQLEDYFGVVLFYRKHQRIELTDQARRYFLELKPLFDTLESVTDSILGSKETLEQLKLNVLPSLSSNWLIPKLEDFKQQHPNISVEIDIGDGDIDFNANGADIAIRVAQTNLWERCYTQLLLEEDLVIVCSPDITGVTKATLHNYELLQHSTRPEMWRQYLRDIGVAPFNLKHSLGFEHFYMLIQAACDGMGIALVPRVLIQKELKNYSLIIPFEEDFQNTYHYYLIAPNYKAELRKNRLFIKWLSKKCVSEG